MQPYLEFLVLAIVVFLSLATFALKRIDGQMVTMGHLISHALDKAPSMLALH
jgi:hypothetical protein